MDGVGKVTLTNNRAREAHLLQHPEEATLEDVRTALLSLHELRIAANEAAEAGGGVAVVVKVETRGNGLSMKVTAPHMSDARVIELTSRIGAGLLSLLEQGVLT